MSESENKEDVGSIDQQNSQIETSQTSNEPSINAKQRKTKLIENIHLNNSFDFEDTIKSFNCAGFRAPPTSPCNTFASGKSILEGNSLSFSTIFDDDNDDTTSNLSKDLITKRRGRKSIPHVATLFDESERMMEKSEGQENDQQSNHLFSSSSASSSSIPSSSIFGFGHGPPPNSPERQIYYPGDSSNSSSLMLSSDDEDQSEGECSSNKTVEVSNSTSDSKIQNDLSNPIDSKTSDNDENPLQTSSSRMSKVDRATKLLQLKTQLHLTHKLEKIRLNSNSVYE